MADVTPEVRADLRKMRKSVMYVGDMSSGSQKVAALLDAILPLLDALDAAEARVAAAEREEAEYHRSLHQAILGQAEREAQDRIAAAEREALERAVQAVERARNAHWQQHLREHPYSDGESCPKDYGKHDAYYDAARIVRDLMPRKDGE